jgi:hypothetical protein
MRFFMSLSPCSEKTQPVCLPAVEDSSSQYPTFPLFQSVVGLSLGFSGFFSLFCAPAIASFLGPNAKDSMLPTEKLAIDGLAIDGLANPSMATDKLTDADDAALALGDELLGDELAFESPIAAEAKPQLHPIPSLSASAQAIALGGNSVQRALQSELQNAFPYGGYQVSVEGSHQPAFTLPGCEFSFCKSDKVALEKEKPSPEEASETDAELVMLLSDPALGHVTQAEISLETEALELTQVESQNTLARPLADEVVTEVDSIGSEDAADLNLGRDAIRIAQAPDFFSDRQAAEISQASEQREAQPDDELGSLRLRLQRSRDSEELGILRLLQTAQVSPPAPPAPPVAFLSGRIGFFATENVLRAPSRLDDRIMQSGITAYYFPRLSESTNLYAIAETSLARYGNFGANYVPPPLPEIGEVASNVDYNQTELQLGLRQRLQPRTYAQIGWRNQRIYSPGYREKLFGINYLEAQLNHRSILNSNMWLDGFYQLRWGFSGPTDRNLKDTSRLRQTFTLSLNYGATPDLRTSLLYQLDFEDYTRMARFDSYQQIIGIISYNLTPESQLSVFGGTRFGRSSSSGIDLDDTFYGAGLNVTVPLF